MNTTPVRFVLTVLAAVVLFFILCVIIAKIAPLGQIEQLLLALICLLIAYFTVWRRTRPQ